jgi:hypothetical protein
VDINESAFTIRCEVVYFDCKRLINSNFVRRRVFPIIDIYHLVCILQKLPTVGAQMAQMKSFIDFCVAFGNFIDGINRAHVGDSAFFEVDDDFLRIIRNIEFFVKGSRRAKKERSVKFVSLGKPQIMSIVSATKPSIIRSGVPESHVSALEKKQNVRNESRL